MAIERLKKALIVTYKGKKEELLEKLFNLRVFHIEDLSYATDEIGHFKKLYTQRNYSEYLSKISLIFSIFKEFGFNQKSFIKSFLPDDIALTEGEFDDVIKNFNFEKFYNEAISLYNRYNEISEVEGKVLEEKAYINLLKHFPFDFSILLGTEKTNSLVGLIKNQQLYKLQENEKDFLKNSFFYVFDSAKGSTKVFFIFLKEDYSKVDEIIKSYGIELIEPKKEIVGFVEEEVLRISEKLLNINKEKNIIISKLKELSSQSKKLITLEDYYSSLNKKEESVIKFIEGKNYCVIKGFVRTFDVAKVLSFSNDDNCFVFIGDPEPQDLVPVSLRNGIIFKPFEFLIKLFGVPSYGVVDPTPLVAILFSVFFGIALGDAFYGLVLAIFGGLFAYKYKQKVQARNFFMIMLYGGITAVIAGLLTGSFAGNFLSMYFPMSGFTVILKSLQIINTNSPSGSMNFLIFAILIGVFTQLLGVFVSVIVKLRQKDFCNALFNGVGWLLFLPGLMFLFVIKSFPQLKMVDSILLYAGLAFLLIGGWISVRNFFFKPVAAVVNLYGIRSSYGITSFLGDALSYSRLFALGLSSSILASSFNLMARAISSMFGNFGIVPLILILLATHALTLVMNVLGSFIHSMRLNFLEFFGRFYEIGTYEFKPLGYNFKNIRVENKREAK